MASTSASAAATAASSPNYSPWAALSAFASSSSAEALCPTTTAGTANAAGQAAPAPGCVLPAVDAPAPVVEQGIVEQTSGGFPLIGVLAGLAALAALTALALSGDAEDDIELDLPPVSPA